MRICGTNAVSVTESVLPGLVGGAGHEESEDMTCKRGERVNFLLSRLFAFLNKGIFDSRLNSNKSYGRSRFLRFVALHEPTAIPSQPRVTSQHRVNLKRCRL